MDRFSNIPTFSHINSHDFWNYLKTKYPLVVEEFKVWIDQYKVANDWSALMQPSTKFHDLPFPMQYGVIVQFCMESVHSEKMKIRVDLLTSVINDFFRLQQYRRAAHPAPRPARPAPAEPTQPPKDPTPEGTPISYCVGAHIFKPGDRVRGVIAREGRDLLIMGHIARSTGNSFVVVPFGPHKGAIGPEHFKSLLPLADGVEPDAQGRPPLQLYVIYDHPSDYPESYVVRRQLVYPGHDPVFDPRFFLQSPSLDVCREQMFQLGLVSIGRQPGDDPVILEVYL